MGKSLLGKGGNYVIRRLQRLSDRHSIYWDGSFPFNVGKNNFIIVARIHKLDVNRRRGYTSNGLMFINYNF